MSGVPATISMPDSTARASHDGRPYSTIHIAAATASGVAIAIPITVSRTVPSIGSRKPPDDFWSGRGRLRVAEISRSRLQVLHAA